jgi:hypothetical protein
MSMTKPVVGTIEIAPYAGGCTSCRGQIKPGSEYRRVGGNCYHVNCPHPTGEYRRVASDAGAASTNAAPASGEVRCFRCARPCTTTDSVVQAGLRWHSTCWNAATDPARIAALNASERARDAGAGMLIEDYVNEEQARHPSLDDVRALELVIKKYDLAARWATMRVSELSPRLVRTEVSRRMARFCHDCGLNPLDDLAIRRAKSSVFDADPALKAAYARS